MKLLQYLLIAFLAMGFFTGCGSSDNEAKTDFFYDVQNALQQNENDEPLEIQDTNDESSNFDSLT